MRLTRRQVLVGAATSGLGAVGMYELVDRLTSSPAPRGHGRLHPEQHLLDGLAVMRDNGVAVVVPPLHHAVITARVATDDLRGAQQELEETLVDLERRYAPTPAGLGVTVAWGLPYFRRYVPRQADLHLPVDLRASRTKRRTARALAEAIRFPSDPPDTILEANDVAVLLRSDVRAHIEDGERRLFRGSRILHATSIRRGFVGSDFRAGPSLAKRMAQAAGVDGADLIPDDAQLFLGFTSTQQAALGPRRIANFETLGYVDLGPAGYFRNGTHMHLSHVFEDLASWYQTFDFQERVDTAFKPGLEAKPGVVTVSQGATEAASAASVRRGFHRDGRIGHSSSIQSTSRLVRDVVADDGTVYRRGTAVPQRADFNTLDNPFAWSASPERDGMQDPPAAGLHFVVFNPTSDDFRRNRLAMDGVLPDGTRLPFGSRDRKQGFNAVLSTSHRQNFIVPPRRHRSFPLVEL
ncbi:MAG: hypothetical protein E6G09_01010 [Actinobacteria bacterium]|nr:MAG: hypothetical protein E6G18_04265 [Actinomycetota bacterium]TML89366.1 MAG: hypothetical protein E6G09_01010 [Actinomycetota bacterium]